MRRFSFAVTVVLLLTLSAFQPLSGTEKAVLTTENALVFIGFYLWIF